jgi:hypothetical protein
MNVYVMCNSKLVMMLPHCDNPKGFWSMNPSKKLLSLLGDGPGHLHVSGSIYFDGGFYP